MKLGFTRLDITTRVADVSMRVRPARAPCAGHTTAGSSPSSKSANGFKNNVVGECYRFGGK